MGIEFNPEKKIFKLDTRGTSYVIIAADDEGFIGHAYYGAKVGDFDLSYRLRISEPPFTPSKLNGERGTFMDTFPFEYPSNGVGDYRESALEILDANGHTAVNLFYSGHKIYDGKPKIPGLPASFGKEDECSTLEITAVDSVLNLEAVLCYTVFYNTDVITRSVKITNRGEQPVYLTKVMSCSLDMDAEDYGMLTLNGSWARERQIELRGIRYGKQTVSSSRGESSHQEHPFIALASRNTAYDTGEVYGINFVYSGNFIAEVEKDQFDCLRVEMGINPKDFRWKLNMGDTFYAPETVLTYSNGGFNGMSHNLHDFYRRHLMRGPYKDRERPILLNSWEAAYFDFDTEKLLKPCKSR